MVLPSFQSEQYNYTQELKGDKGKYKHIQKEGYVLIIVWYVVFLGIIPYLCHKFLGIKGLFLYLPTIDLIANVFATSVVRLNALYSLSPWDGLSYLSTNFISLVALLGAAHHGLTAMKHYGTIHAGMMTLGIMFAITYLLPTPLIPYVIHKINKKTYGTPVVKEHLDGYGLMGGFVLSLILVLIEGFIIGKVTPIV